ncbi:MAG: protein kinase family protein [Calothrix sp. SM1_7_51]|nr:protein kinase family protein [Calothrix sp. SM1_7_51]
MLKNLEISAIVRPYSLSAYQNGYALIMEDFGGVSLQEYTRTNTLDLRQILCFAIQLADILDGLYREGVIHKDIKPANILIHPEKSQIKLIDFSIACVLARENSRNSESQCFRRDFSVFVTGTNGTDESGD